MSRKVVTHSDVILSEIADLVIAQNELLGQVLSRLPEQPAPVEGFLGGTVELREPEVAAKQDEVKEPAPRRQTSRRSSKK